MVSERNAPLSRMEGREKLPPAGRETPVGLEIDEPPLTEGLETTDRLAAGLETERAPAL